MSTDAALFESMGRIPRGFEPDHHSPEQFIVRCTRCGVIGRKASRATAQRVANGHGLDCAPTGVTPVARTDANHEGPRPDDIVTLTYRSDRTGNPIDTRGVVIEAEPTAPCTYELAIDDTGRDRMLLVEYDADRETADYARSVTKRGGAKLGPVVEIELRSVATDGGVSEKIASTPRTLRGDDDRERYRVEAGLPTQSITYGPRGNGEEYVLALRTTDGPVDVELNEAAMYTLWTEVRGVPWPEREDGRDRLIRQLVHAANHADEAMLHDALEALGMRR